MAETPKWDETEDIQDIPKFEDTNEISEEPELKTSPISRLESLVRGAGQGVTLGFGDELAAAAAAVSDDVQKVWGFGPAAVDKQLTEQGFKGDITTSEPTYKTIRDEFRTDDKAAREANPGTFMAGEIAGALALPTGSTAGISKNAARFGSGFLKGLAKLPGPTKAIQTGAKMAPKAAVEAAAYGAGQAEELKDVPGTALESAKTAALLTAGAPVALSGIAKATSNIGKAAAKNAIKFTTGLPQDKLDDLFKNPEKYGQTARSLDEMAKDIEGRINNLGEEAKEFSQRARKSLNSEKTLQSSRITDRMRNYAETLPRPKKSAYKDIMNYAKELDTDFAEGMSQKDIQMILDELAEKAGYHKVAGGKSPVEEAFKNLRGEFSEELKKEIPEYRKEMAESAKRMSYLKDVSKKLGVQDDIIRDYDELGDLVLAERRSKLRNVDTVANKLKTLVKEDKTDLRDLLLNEKGKEFLGLDGTFSDEIAAREFQKWAEKQGYATKAITAAKAILGSAGVSLSMGNPAVAAILGAAATAPAIAGKVVKNPNLISKANKVSKSLTEVVPKAMEAAPNLSTAATAVVGAKKAAKEEDRMKFNMERLNEASADNLSELAEELEGQGKAGEEYARVLDKAILDEDKRKTILFGLQQQPAFREMLKKIQDK